LACRRRFETTDNEQAELAMPVEQTQDQETRARAERIRGWFADELVSLAFKGLKRMLLPEKTCFCHKAMLDQSGELSLVGRSDRYTAMALIGLAMQERFGRKADFETDTICEHLVSWVQRNAEPGDAGLVLCLLTIRGDDRAEHVAKIICSREDAIYGQHAARNSMSLGNLLAGLSVAMRKGCGPKELEGVARRCRDMIVANREPATGLFSMTGRQFRRNILKWKANCRLGSFASQVYPTIGLSCYSRISGDDESLRLATETADAMCRLQGPQGQWWWIYDVRRAVPAIRYPVYSIHQDAMGPMALLAVSLAAEGKRNYTDAIWKSLNWLNHHPECPGKRLVDRDAGVVWRAVQRDEPARTGAYGLGLGERVRLNVSAWTGLPDRRAFTDGFICDECRPYHLGWILVAAAMFSMWEGLSE
jgi:hypothetical protein